MANLGITVSLPDNDTKNIIKLLNEKKINTMQLMFSKKNISSDDIKKILKLTKKFKYVFIHSSYLINIGSELVPINNHMFNNSIDILVEEIKYSEKIKANGIIVHLGKNTKKQYDNSIIYNNMIANITELFARLKKKELKTMVLLETSSGQGGEMCHNLEEFVDFILLFKNTYFYEQIGICIDTCHIFQAGYNINDKIIIKKVHDIFKPIENKIKLIHLNSSLKNVGMHIDKHEIIGEGFIKVNNLLRFILPYRHIPVVLETKPPYLKQINLIKNNKLIKF
jgi:deoxyribonuclease IV